MAWLYSAAYLVCLIAVGSMGEDNISFIVLGDWGMGNNQQISTANLMKRIVVDQGSKFVVNVGDNFYKETKDANGQAMGGVLNLTDPLWQKYFEEVYNGPLDALPFYSVLGNHDYMGNTTAQLEYNTLDIRWILPVRYYAQEIPINDTEAATFVFIDTSPFIQDYYDKPENDWMKEQLAVEDYSRQLYWLNLTLSNIKTKWKIVVGHHPIVSHAGNTIYKVHDTPRSMQAIKPILEEQGVQAYFCGHVHDLQHLNNNGVDYFISGGGAFGKVYFPDKEMMEFVNFKSDAAGVMSVTLTPSQMESTFLATNGTILHTAITLV